MVLAVTSGTISYIIALGKTRRLPLIALVSVLGLGGTVFLSAPLGLNAVAACVLAYHLVYLLFSQLVILHRMGGVPTGDLFRDAVPPLVAAIPLALTELALLKLLESQGASALLILAVAIPPGFAAYCGVLRAAFPESWHSLVDVYARVLGRST